MRKIKRLMIANRGEIALRIIRAGRELGITTIALFSTEDRLAPFVLDADEAYLLHGNDSKQTYLNIEQILRIAAENRVDAIHPGYGFLSENADFSEAVSNAGMIFIGPPASAIRKMGGKTGAREIAQKAGVPIVPGTIIPVTSIDEAKKISEKIGYPILVKASAGGGGKGMRRVDSADELPSSFERAVNEAEKAFGSGSVYVEKYIDNPKHIEIQILADSHGNVIHLGERDCSIQRRHQKVVEECPSTVLTPELRATMGATAVSLAKACGYVNAGTIEFLFDSTNSFYFLEMNTRLQVEHPVTEFVCNLDLVKMQIAIAEGEELPLKQEDLRIDGHAIECRISAEDSRNNFLPSTGNIEYYRPAEGLNVRNDSGIQSGSVVSRLFDPLLAKLIVKGKTREEAIQKMLRALDDYKIFGVETTIPFCQFALQHEAFLRGNYSINFVADHFLNQSEITTDKIDNKFPDKSIKDEDMIKLAAIIAALSEDTAENASKSVSPADAKKSGSDWKSRRFGNRS